MKNSLILAVSVALLSLAFRTSQSAAQDAVKPGPEHAHFKDLEGVWDATMKMSAPGAPADETKGTMTYKLQLGGLWLISDFRTEEFSGHGINGYDPVKKKYVGTWVDTASPGIMTFEGTLDKTGKIMTEMAETKTPDGAPQKMKMVTQVKGKDSHVTNFFMVDSDGKESPMMTIEYRRRK